MITKTKAFTLIELLVVVAIIGILAAVGVVAYNGYTASAKEAVCKNNFQLYSKMQKIIADELPLYPTNTLPYHTVFSNDVGGAPLGIWATSSPMHMTYVK